MVSIPPYRLGLFPRRGKEETLMEAAVEVSIPPYRLGLFPHFYQIQHHPSAPNSLNPTLQIRSIPTRQRIIRLTHAESKSQSHLTD